ncbi:MAG: hypothetical protein QG606_155 [Patescibacteria group bacterium]|jgi:hypothetical protein|nr:hypothetical protein [Patescibacteria group bacterium]
MYPQEIRGLIAERERFELSTPPLAKGGAPVFGWQFSICGEPGTKLELILTTLSGLRPIDSHEFFIQQNYSNKAADKLPYHFHFEYR